MNWPPSKPKWEVGDKVFFTDLGCQYVGEISGYTLHLGLDDRPSSWVTQYWCRGYDDTIDEDKILGRALLETKETD